MSLGKSIIYKYAKKGEKQQLIIIFLHSADFMVA